MSNVLTFKDLNFKLAVINELMYEQEILTPALETANFLAKARKISTEEANNVVEAEGYEVIPEVLTYFKNLEITADMVEGIKEIYIDGGNEIYLQIIPFWDGEDDIFNIKSADDVSLLPNLKKITLFYDEDESILEKFEEKGVEAEWL